MRPLIGISCSMGQTITSLTQENPPQLQHRINDTYLRAISQAGGTPVILPNNTDLSCVEDIICHFDGFLLSGGDDIDPVLYGERATGKLGTVVPRRDSFEIALTRTVLETTNKPILGICRGMQIMNVAMGGSLYQDLPSDGKLCHSLTMYPRNAVTHPVQVFSDTRMAQIMGEGIGQVNSFHHQAVKRLAGCFVCAAKSLEDDVLEALELPGDRFAVGVQWHPEELTQRPEAQSLFHSFVQAAQNQKP